MSEQQSTVEYREIEGFHGYRVGNDGSVWSSLSRSGANVKDGEEWTRSSTWRLLKHKVNKKTGYHSVMIFRNKRKHEYRVHRLVLAAFCGKRMIGMECRHLNGNKDDNSLKNLVWGTHVENVMDNMVHGVVPRGEDHCCARLSDAEVIEIRRTINATELGLARRFNVSHSAIRLIGRMQRWKHLEVSVAEQSGPSI